MRYFTISLWLTFILTVLLTSWSLFKLPLFHLHDTIHAARVAEVTTALLDGHFPVRWAQNFGRGYGMPLFEFYAPLPYYFGALCSIAGLSWSITMKLMMVIPSMVTFWGMYFLGKSLWSRPSGLIVAVAGTLAPYRAVDLFVRGAFSEIWGMMFLPWLVVGALWIIKEKRWGRFIFILAGSCMLLSHNLTAFVSALTLPPLLLFYMFLFSKEKLKSVFVFLVCSLYIGALAAFYMLPAITEQKYTNISTMNSGYFDYTNHFIFIRQLLRPYWGYGNSAPWPYNDMSYFLGYGQILAIIFSFAFTLYSFIKSGFKIFFDKKTQFFIAIFFVTLFCLFMMLTKSRTIWLQFPMLSMLQFPWRWLLIATLFVATLSGYAFSRNVKKAKVILMASLIGAMCLNGQYFRPKAYLDSDQQYYGTTPEQIRQQMKDSVPEYYSRSARDLKVISVDDFLDFDEKVSAEIKYTSKVHLKNFTYTVQKKSGVEFKVLDFPGWVVRVDDTVIPHQTSEHGTIWTQLPTGTHFVELEFTKTRVRYWSDILSFCSWMLFIVLFFYEYYRATFSLRTK